MTSEQVWLAAAVLGAVLAAGAALLVAARARSHARRAETTAAALAERVALLESSAAGRRPVDDEPAAVDAAVDTYVITGVRLDDRDEPAVPAASHAAPIDGRLFTDIVARETVVKAASWTHGLRRALSPASRNRIRFEVRQETRRAGRERRAETKQALREFRARERAALREDVA
ncbi:hypothetical protein GCM10011376_36830 [Nocardioides flavus (ex Wang et al. 2016)]|uniref:Uncharacterized protein n=1 Tax=Nocardioides flavus (ex Wang et al. 2016) TaxID=2058780 RepID=A0ABQ3HN23_9ACTN|nr:hypothetical protein [Nocardioides flavus (ex Wang et al. 2016)]GHE19073.1 hypothetical protein GCM10011376_36830 [Nocardioides flavus (ex Wang et al. 2016)]